MNAIRISALNAAVVGAFALTAPAVHADNSITFKTWNDGLGTSPNLAIGESITATRTPGSNNYADNASLMNAAWAHSGNSPWYTFYLTGEADVSITLAPTSDASALFNPGMTVWASGDTKFNGGTADFSDVAANEWNSPHSFNAVGQIGDAGTLWATGSNGNLLETLAYAVTGESHSDPAQNGWGEVILNGVHDVSVSDTFERGVTGTAVGNTITLNFNDMQAGWYTVFFGGTNTDYTAVSYTLSVSAVAAVPEPESWAMLLGGLGLIAAIARRRIV
ncbi:FxDxF family PEP-CTERM protein [Methyloversatilis thermotolerans]|uniref:FxDxF family PEP-CTERM protein n=1 Tax=Methyloversatilis thermotolerans TaxID=1346290 RepID=UPI000371F75F|nr:FxDxF family PEP-CTERM protein [Methyloversatilis thermotolerans]